MNALVILDLNLYSDRLDLSRFLIASLSLSILRPVDLEAAVIEVNCLSFIIIGIFFDFASFTLLSKQLVFKLGIVCEDLLLGLLGELVQALQQPRMHALIQVGAQDLNLLAHLPGDLRHHAGELRLSLLEVNGQ